MEITIHMHNAKQKYFNLPNLGLGVGLRHVHFNYILEHWPAVDWFEIISENFIDSRGKPRYVLDQIAERYPLVMHGVSLSIGSTDPLNIDYLQKLKALAQEIRAVWVSDHLCWTGVLGKNTHDLLPLPLNEETLQHTITRVKFVQEFLERPLILENPSSYITFAASTFSEAQFLTALSEATGCGLLLDVNNIYVSCRNHNWNAHEYLQQIPSNRIVQFHLAGHTDLGTHCIDTHDGHVIDAVWELYRAAYKGCQGAATLLEWDAHIPTFPELHAEILKAREWLQTEQPFATEHVSQGSGKVPHPLHYITAEVEA
jgi:uncharacterized protein